MCEMDRYSPGPSPRRPTGRRYLPVESNTEISASDETRMRPSRSTATSENIEMTSSPGPSSPPIVTTVSSVMTHSGQVTSPDTCSGSWA